MPPATAPERTGASGQYYSVPAPPPPRRMLSPVGYIALGVAALVTVFIILWIVSSFQTGRTGTSTQDRYQQVDLGQITRELAPEAGALVREPFMLKIVLVLNPDVRDLAALKSQVERRRDLFRDIIWSELINPKSDPELRKPAMLETLKTEIRQRINQELGGARDAQESIVRVIFPERRLPERR
jgi:flagellar basal body-associated protein FliL